MIGTQWYTEAIEQLSSRTWQFRNRQRVSDPVRLVREQTANCIKDLNALRTEVMRAAGWYPNDLGNLESTTCNWVLLRM